MELCRQFSQVCASGDLAKVAELVDSEPRSQGWLTQGLCAAIDKKNIPIVEFLLKKVAVIDPEIANAAASAKFLSHFPTSA